MTFFLKCISVCVEKGVYSQRRQQPSKYSRGGHSVAASFTMRSPAQGQAGPGALSGAEWLVLVSPGHIKEQHTWRCLLHMPKSTNSFCRGGNENLSTCLVTTNSKCNSSNGAKISICCYLCNNSRLKKKKKIQDNLISI